MSPVQNTTAGSPSPVLHSHEPPPSPCELFLLEKPTTLDPLETSSNSPASTRARPLQQDVGITFRHGGWHHDRNRVSKALHAHPDASDRRRLAFDRCGSDAFVESRQIGYVNRVTEYRLRSTHCHDRWCLPCAAERAAVIRENLLRHMHGLKNLSLITLTLRGEGQALSTLLDRAYRHLQELRNTACWKKAVTGGAAIIEAKLGADKKRWHVHWHIVCQAKYFDQRQLSQAWLKITGDSMIVDIRRVQAMSGAVQYICKYVTKAADTAVIRSPEHLREGLTAFQGRRLVSTFGTWRGLHLSQRNENEEVSQSATAWVCEGRLDDLWQGWKNHDPRARAIIETLIRQKTKTQNQNSTPPPLETIAEK